ncbi:hypothetical protein K439DRAFT_1610282 [Ramaria rubella]|nr:hypothetical protein K439DRAFT_1610282 [Ramaria rubella]
MPIDQNANHFMMRMKRKLAAPKQQQHGQNLSRVDWKLAALEDEVINELAKKHNRNEWWMHQQVCRTRNYGHPRKVSKYHAWLHVQSLKINEDSRALGLVPGQKKQRQDLQQLAKQTISHKDIPEAEMDEMLHCLEEKRLIKKKGIQLRPAVHSRDVKATTTHVADELKNLSLRCSTASLAVTVQTESSHSNQPMTYHDDISRDFIELLFGMDFDEFTLKFEACTLFRIKGVAKNSNERKTMTKCIVCALVRCGLRTITGDNTLEMEWKRYNTKIVNVHQVMLVGWPVKEFDPHILDIADTCVSALKGLEPTCYWCKVDDKELSEHQELIANKKASGEIVMKM